MKKIIIAALAICISFSSAFAQTESVKSFYEKYTNDVKASDYTIQGWLLKMASEFSDDEAAGKVLEKITQLRVLIMEDGHPITSHEYKDFLKVLQKDSFEELIKVKDKDCNVDFFIREEGQSITNVLMMVHQKDGFVLLSLEGELNLDDLKNIHLDIEGTEHFDKVVQKVPRA